LAHNVRDAGIGQPKADVLYTFGRADSLDVEAIRRLTKSLSRFLTPEEALKIQGPDHGEATLRFLKSVPVGGAHLLRGLWEQLGLPKALSQCMKEEDIKSNLQRMLPTVLIIMPKILIVDDEKDIVDLISYNLEKARFSTVKAYDGETALKLVKTQKPDLIILDLMLPKMNGLDVCRTIRHNPETVGLPIIMLTAKNSVHWI
jgi:hypothetical protein